MNRKEIEKGIREKVVTHPITGDKFTIFLPIKDFRMFCEEILVSYTEKTNDPEIGLYMRYATKEDYRIYEEYEKGNITAEAYIRSLSNGGLYEALSNMHCHQFR